MASNELHCCRKCNNPCVDKLRAMAAFVHIVEKGSLTAAAGALGTSPPSIVRSLAGLERALGARLGRVLGRHILPNVLGPVLILASMEIPVVVTIEAGLSFLGVGIRPPTPSWGSILNDGYTFIRETPWVVIAGGLPLILTTLGFTFFGEALRDVFDPRLRREA